MGCVEEAALLIATFASLRVPPGHFFIQVRKALCLRINASNIFPGCIAGTVSDITDALFLPICAQRFPCFTSSGRLL